MPELSAPDPAPRALVQTAEGLPDGARPSLGPWTFDADPALRGAVLERLTAHPPQPGSARLSGFEGPLRAARIAWGIAALQRLGHRLHDRERSAWVRVAHRADPHRDGAALAGWKGFASGDPWSLRRPWEDAFLPTVARTFDAVLAARKVPRRVRGRAAQDLREDLFYRMIGGVDVLAGWREVAARTLETAGVGPVDGAMRSLDPAAFARVARCPGARRSADLAAEALMPQVPTVGRGLAFEAILVSQPGALEQALDLEVALRLCDRWSRADSHFFTDKAMWRLAVQNRGRARGRLRAVLAEQPADTLVQALSTLDALHARTVAALRRYAWAWAWNELARNIPLDPTGGVTPPCRFVPDEAALDDAAIQSWLTLVVLRGRVDHLRRWLRGGVGRDSVWGRLLAEALPGSLTDGPQRGRQRRYGRLKATLGADLEERLERLGPVLGRVAACERGRRSKIDVLDALRPGWSDAVRLPSRGFPSLVAAARAFLEARP